MAAPAHEQSQSTQSPQPLCLHSLTDSPEATRSAERRLSGERGREPRLYELVEDLMARQRLARPFTGRSESTRAEPGSRD